MKKLVSLCLALFLLLPMCVSSDALNIRRVYGSDRYETALKINKECFSRSKRAILGSGEDFTSSMYGSYIASATNTPFLVNTKHGIRGDVLKELKRLGVQKVFIMGGYDVMDKSIENTLVANGIKSYERVVSRYGYSEPSKSVINRIRTGHDADGQMIEMIVNDQSFPDLMSSIPFLARANQKYGYILQSYTRTTPYYELGSPYQFIIGGYNTVPKSFKTTPELKGRGIGLYHNQHGEVYGRLAGKNRYETCAQVLKAYEVMFNRNIDTFILVDGENYPDALASSLLATKYNTTVFLIPKGSLNYFVKNIENNGGYQNVIIVGGPNSVN